ncbi:mucoidy inhibitor MuiA family protein [Flavihumibacter sp. RY-1]|uniref:Mucoidy inhibitor MuiA family protein n=1 Tax=Flavihumibacter fluminis TaxID=2909236 RepID=A0ABS9BK43_9BACT|nr:mucoidy inhibitor MuiA family protein [Flavihumibacter fluminis]MCF1716061.1 mucoidy inhibitor MuiA family protein [Flavihumibacter fluminis]
MKKHLLLPFLILLGFNSYTQPKRITADTKIESVTVFLKGAEIKRTGTVAVPLGKSELVLQGISTDIESPSVQVKLEGDLTILSVGVRKNFLQEEKIREEVKQLQDQINGIEEKQSRQRKMLEVLKQEEAMLVRNQELKSGTVAVKPADLKAALDFQRERLEELYNKQLEIEKSQVKLEKDKQSLRNQANEMNSVRNLAVNEIYAVVECRRAGLVPLSATYLVNKAGWHPSYSISVKDISAPLDIQFVANVYQSSGEVWKDIKLALSSGNPSQNNEKPQLEPWYLRYMTPGMSSGQFRNVLNGTAAQGRVVEDKGMPIAGASVMVKGTAAGTLTDANGYFSLNAVPRGATLVVSSVGFQGREMIFTGGFLSIPLAYSANALEEVVVMGYGGTSDALEGSVAGVQRSKREMSPKPLEVTTTYQPTTTKYEIKEIYTILNDGKVNTIDVKKSSLPAVYEYYAAPKLEEAAYLTARLTNWQELELMAGEANLFFEGTFLGKSFIDPALAEDTLYLSLGRDANVIVKRTLVKDFSSKRFMGGNKSESKQFELSVRNNKKQPITILLEDQYPISTMKEIEVERDGHDGGRLNSETGLVSWNLTLAPGTEQKKTIRFTVKYPKEKRLQLD